MRKQIAALLVLIAASAATPACEGPTDVIIDAAEAARANDADAYEACFTPRSRSVLRLFRRSADMRLVGLARLEAGDVVPGKVQALPPGEDLQERAVVSVREGAEEIPVVVHHLGRAWRIDLVDTERVLTGFAAPF